MKKILLFIIPLAILLNANAMSAKNDFIELQAIDTPQDATFFWPKDQNKRILPKQEQEQLANRYLQRFFSPWKENFSHQQRQNQLKNNLQKTLSIYQKQTTWGENLRPHYRVEGCHRVVRQ